MTDFAVTKHYPVFLVGLLLNHHCCCRELSIHMEVLGLEDSVLNTSLKDKSITHYNTPLKEKKVTGLKKKQLDIKIPAHTKK